jgi:hypothetical protein
MASLSILKFDALVRALEINVERFAQSIRIVPHAAEHRELDDLLLDGGGRHDYPAHAYADDGCRRPTFAAGEAGQLPCRLRHQRWLLHADGNDTA